MSKLKICSKCKGNGTLDHCGKCNGSGVVSCRECGGSGEVRTYCSVCHGTGEIRKSRLKNCSQCHGSGVDRHSLGIQPGPCGACGGSGQKEDFYSDICPNCNGRGYTSSSECNSCNGTGKTTCPICHGENRHAPSTCDHCNGTGKVVEREEEYDSESSSSSSSEGGPIQAILGLLILVAMVWGGWIGIKSLWNWWSGGESAVVTSEMMLEGWENHLKERCAAFEDGLCERDVDGKGLVNYTWGEWQEKCNREKVSSKPNYVAGKAKDIGEQMSAAAKGLGDKAKSVIQGFVSPNLECGQTKCVDLERSESEQVSVRATEGGRAQKSETSKPAMQLDEKLEPVAPGGALQRSMAPLVESPKPVALPEEGSKPVASGGDAANGNDKRRASADSKKIATHVQGTGKTRDDALSSAFRLAVYRCVGIWVGSKPRMNEKRDELIAIQKTITQADIARFEIENTEEKDGLVVVKAKVSVSKKQIAAKFAKVFPDVFGNE